MADHQENAKPSPPHRPPPPKISLPPQRKTPPSLKKHMEQIQPLSPCKVRWFYLEEKKWIPFNGRDSLEIERVFRSLPEEFQSPLIIPNKTESQINIERPTVRGSLYEVDILDRECSPIYWKESAVSIRRGTWFKGNMPGNLEPMDEKEALKVEEGHIHVFRLMGRGTAESSPASQNVIHQIKVGVNRVEWHDISEVYIISETTGSRLAQKIGISGQLPLQRGYGKESTSDDTPGDITHIVFLVHGMGQLYHGQGGIVHSRKKFSEAIEKGKRRFFKDIDGNGTRAEFFPIEWRTKLKLDEGMIEKITPPNLGSLRKVINDTTLDVFYYTSPFYREEIMQAIRQELNMVYTQYTSRNPSFEQNGGKVSIIAHSLGSVIIHDVLTLWNSYLMEKDKKNADVQVAGGERSYSWFWGWGKERLTDQSTSSESAGIKDIEQDLKAQLHEARLKVAKVEAQISGAGKESVQENECYSLRFKVEHVFNIGSPLGVFLIMRGIRPRDDVEQHILPASVCKRTFNIYDPADPVAYRLEPVIYDYYSSIPPVRLTHVDGTLEPKQKIKPPQGGGWLRSLFGSKAAAAAANEPIEYQSKEDGSNIDLPKAAQFEKTDEILKGRKDLKHRLDYVLETSMVEYFSAITSHQAYWHSLDFAKFVLQAIYSDDVGGNQAESEKP